MTKCHCPYRSNFTLCVLIWQICWYIFTKQKLSIIILWRDLALLRGGTVILSVYFLLPPICSSNLFVWSNDLLKFCVQAPIEILSHHICYILIYFDAMQIKINYHQIIIHPLYLHLKKYTSLTSTSYARQFQTSLNPSCF